MGEVIQARTMIGLHKKSENVSPNETDESSESDTERPLTEEEILFGKQKKRVTPEEKLNEDRKYLEGVMRATFQELQFTRTCQTLINAIKDYKENMQFVEEIKERIHHDQETVKTLKQRLVSSQEEKKRYENKMEIVVYQLKDKLQKSKACLDLEVKYIFKRSETSITQAEKLWADKEKELKVEQQLLRSKTAHEDRINNEIKNFMRQSQKECEDLLEMWKKKYDDNVVAKDEELADLENDKAINLKKITELARRVHIYETFVENDRIEKQREKEKKEKEEQEYNCIVKVQAWWRGTMVRKKLGPFAEKKVEKKAKKGGKKGKGKK